MAKRYHQSKKDRMDERQGMERHDYYAGIQDRRRQEMEDAGMISEDHNAIANLPQNVVIRAYPKTGPYMPEGLDDTIRGVDKQMDMDDNKRKEHNVPKKV